MYIKVRPDERMHLFDTTNDRQFNDTFNTLVGSEGVEYAAQFPIRVHDGRTYFGLNRVSVLSKYAHSLLHGNLSPNAILAPSYEYEHMSLPQRAALSYLFQASEDNVQTALSHCAKVDAIPESALHLFGDHATINLRSTGPVGLHSSSATGAVDLMDISTVNNAAVAASPARSLHVVMNEPGSSTTQLSLKAGATKRRKR